MATGAHLLAINCADQAYTLAFTPDGSRLAIVPMDRTIVMLDSVPLRERLRGDLAHKRAQR